MRVFTVLGPSGSGKTSLVHALAGLEGGHGRTLTIAGVAAISSFRFMEEDWAAIDMAGGVETLGMADAALAASDIAILCVPPDADAAVLAAPFLRRIEAAGVPSLIFINRIDAAQSRVSEVVSALQTYSRAHIVLREVPIREGGMITGFVDLVSERAWKFRDGRPSVLIDMPASVKDREAQARAELLESYADFDDQLMEELIEDRKPPLAEVFDITARTVQHHDLVPCFFGSSEKHHGVTRLMKSLRHDAPGVAVAAERLGGALAVGMLGDVVKHLGKVVVLRAIGGPLAAGARLGGADLGPLTELDLKTPLAGIAPGQIGIAVKSDHLAAGQVLTRDGAQPAVPPGFAPWRRVLTPQHEKDDARLLTALARLAETDPSLTLASDENSGRPVLGTQGPQHLRRVLGRIAGDFGVPVSDAPVPPAFRETIPRGTEVHHRHRKQSGGAGQFADVVIAVQPQARGAGFAFRETVKGGAVPRNYIPSVEDGVREALIAGPMGFPVVDLSVELKDGKHHAVDSSDHAFRTAGKSALREALAEVGTVLLQPVMKIDIHVPSVFSGALVPLVSGLKGQVLGFGAHDSVPGWDVFQTLLPMAAEDQLFAQLAAATRGTAWFTTAFDHYQETRKEEVGL